MSFTIDLSNPVVLMTLDLLKVFIISFLLVGLNYCVVKFALGFFKNILSKDFYNIFNEICVVLFIFILFFLNILGDIKIIIKYLS